VALLNTQIGGVVPRQAMKDASGASQMDPKTQVSSLHGTSMLTAATLPFESNVVLALVHDAGGENDRKLIAPASGGLRQPARSTRVGGGAGQPRGRQCAQRGGGRSDRNRRSAPAESARAALRFMLERFHAAASHEFVRRSATPSTSRR